MLVVASKELKNRLGRYLAIVRDGGTIQVTDRGKPAAYLVPAGGPEERAGRVLSRLAAKGGVRIGTGAKLSRRKGVALTPGISAAGMVAEERR